MYPKLNKFFKIRNTWTIAIPLPIEELLRSKISAFRFFSIDFISHENAYHKLRYLLKRYRILRLGYIMLVIQYLVF